jgi:hypothetical protein
VTVKARWDSDSLKSKHTSSLVRSPAKPRHKFKIVSIQEICCAADAFNRMIGAG